MKPIETEQTNVIYAKDQPEYQPLPANKTEDGTVTSCWELTDEELLQVMATKRIYISQMTFNKPLQPILPSTTF